MTYSNGDTKVFTYETARTQYIPANGNKLAYRLFGNLSSSNPALVFCQHFRGTMDHWDPALVNPLAQTRPILLFDNAGVGKSAGTVPDTFHGWAANVIALIEALQLKQVDLFGYSMGGMSAQLVALNAPHLIRRLILGGTTASFNEGTEWGPPWAFQAAATAGTEKEQHDAFLKTYYSLTEEKQAQGEEWWKRMTDARTVEPRSDYVGEEGTQLQIKAVMNWLTEGGEGEHSHERLGELKMPVFVAAGDGDLVVPVSNSILLSKSIKTSHLHVYPNVGHGFLNEYADMFGQHVRMFLDAKKVV
ncbi:hypothetical protein MMC09_004924 [Bachmanniomyces sp. S44760]|nr:hypothetical protein [Bachmanniomyces sp. S44760]